MLQAVANKIIENRNNSLGEIKNEKINLNSTSELVNNNIDNRQNKVQVKPLHDEESFYSKAYSHQLLFH
jgi:hypothetical protein